jgi:hypothetical protein
LCCRWCVVILRLLGPATGSCVVGPTVSFAGSAVHREQSRFCFALSGRRGGDNGSPSDGFFPTFVFGQSQQEQQTDLRLLSPRGSRVQDITSSLCKKAMAVRETGPRTEIDSQRGSTYVLYIIRPPATFEASRRYQVDAIAKHQPRACCGSSNRMKTKAGCVGTGPCNYLCTTLSMRRLCPRTTTAGKVSSVARTTTNSIVDVPRRHSAESFVLHLRPSFLSDCICTDRLLSRPTNGGGLSCQQIVARATIQVKS